MEALLSFVIRTVKGGTQVNVNEGISPVEVAKFQYSRSGSRPILSPTLPAETHPWRDLPPAAARSFDRQQSSTMGHDLTFRLDHDYHPQ